MVSLTDIAIGAVGAWWAGSSLTLVFGATFAGFVAALCLSGRIVRSPKRQEARIILTTMPERERRRQWRYVAMSLLVRTLFFTTVVDLGLVSFSDFSIWRSVLVISGIYLWTEIWFYSTHRLLHTRALFWLHRPTT